VRAMGRVFVFSVALLSACRPYDPPEAGDANSRCCGDSGICIPRAFVPESLGARLPEDVCGAGSLCAPELFFARDGLSMSGCAASDLDGGTSLGLCLPECFLPAALVPLIPRATCSAPSHCVPCAGLGPGQPGCE
jgi:hypothetical protein